MSAQPDTEIRIIVDGRTIVARPRPEDQGRLAGLPGPNAQITLQPSSTDTTGHVLGNDITVDVEGHAMVLRLPNAADAAVVRRLLAVGTLTATIAVGGVLATARPAAAPQAPAAGAPLAAPLVQSGWANVDADLGIADTAAQKAAEAYAGSGAGQGTTLAAPPAQSGWADVDADLGIADTAAQSAAEGYAQEQRPVQHNPRLGGSRPE